MCLTVGWQKNKPDEISEVSTQSDSTQFKPTFSRQELGAGLYKIISQLSNNSNAGKGKKALISDDGKVILFINQKGRNWVITAFSKTSAEEILSASAKNGSDAFYRKGITTVGEVWKNASENQKNLRFSLKNGENAPVLTVDWQKEGMPYYQIPFDESVDKVINNANIEYVVNSICSIHGKENHNTAINKLENGYGRYVNMELAASYETAFGVQFPGASFIKNSSKHIIVDEIKKSSPETEKNQEKMRFSLKNGENCYFIKLETRKKKLGRLRNGKRPDLDCE